MIMQYGGEGRYVVLTQYKVGNKMEAFLILFFFKSIKYLLKKSDGYLVIFIVIFFLIPLSTLS